MGQSGRREGSVSYLSEPVLFLFIFSFIMFWSQAEYKRDVVTHCIIFTDPQKTDQSCASEARQPLCIMQGLTKNSPCCFIAISVCFFLSKGSVSSGSALFWFDFISILIFTIFFLKLKTFFFLKSYVLKT